MQRDSCDRWMLGIVTAGLVAVPMLLTAGGPVPARAGPDMGEPAGRTVTAADVGADSLAPGLLAYLEEKRAAILYSLRTMPAEEYDREFVPGQRTFGQQSAHVAEMNFAACSALAGERPPTPEAGDGTRKEQLVGLIARSFDYCREVIETHGDAALSGEFDGPEGQILQKAKMLFFLVGNWADHYGHFATYLRLTGLEAADTWRLPAEILGATTRR